MKAVYTISPSWLIKKRKDFINGVTTLEKLGFKVINKRLVTRIPSTRRKVQQIHSAFLDKKVEVNTGSAGWI